MDYRKIIRSRRLRMLILSGMQWVPDKMMVRIQYFIQTGKILKLNNPDLFNEKLQAYKLRYKDPIMLRCTDKFVARDYIREKGYEGILVPLIGVYDNLSDVKFSEMPKKFVIKTSDGSGGHQVLICKDKEQITEKDFYSIVGKWVEMPKPKKHIAREWAYQNGHPRRLLVEYLLEDPKDRNKDIDDYKFFCFNGKYKIMQLHKDRSADHKAGFWDDKMHFIKDVNILYPTFDHDIPLPDNIWEMVKIAEDLSKGFPYVRVDLYNVGGKIYFSELTFYPASGYIPFNPDSFNKRLGDYFTHKF